MALTNAIQALLDSKLVWRTRADPEARARFDLDEISGRMVEISGHGASAVLSAACGLVLAAQRRGEPVAWVCGPSTFFPPDLAGAGIDLAALAVIRAARPSAALRAADVLLRSSAFGLVVVDLGGGEIPLAVQTRLVGLAQRHGSALVILTLRAAHAPSSGSLVSLHARATRRERGAGLFLCDVQVVKDRRRGPGWSHQEVLRGPPGLR